MDEKRDWLAAFILEPESGGHTIKNSFSRTVDNTKGSLKKWMTIDEYGGPRGAYADSLESSSFGHLGSMRKMSFDQPDPGLGTTRNAGYFDLSNTSAPAGNSTSMRCDVTLAHLRSVWRYARFTQDQLRT